MFNTLNRLYSTLQWKIPLLALSLSVGVVAETANPVLASHSQAIHQSQTISLESKTTADSFSSYSSSRQTTNFTIPDDISYSHNWKTSLRSIGNVKQYQASITNTLFRRRTTLPQEDGVYLYGQSSEPGQIGKGYIIFERKGGRVTGALYMPSSEFSCFRGALRQNGLLAMTVNSYPGEASTPQVASARTFSGAQDNTNYDYSVKLQNYYRLSSIGASDRKVLQMCKSS